MKNFIVFLMLWSGLCFAQGQLPRDTVYIGTTPQGVGGGGPFQLTNSYSNIQILTPAAAIVVKMPTGTVVKKGSKWRIVNQSTTAANTLSIQASDATDIYASMQYGYVEMIAKQDNPTTYTHWLKTDVSEKGILTFTTRSSPNANPWAAAKTCTVYYSRKGQTVSISMGSILASGNSTADKIEFPDGSVPSRLRCDAYSDAQSAYISDDCGIAVHVAGSASTTPGYLRFYCSSSGNAGRIEITKDCQGNNFTSSAGTTGFYSWSRSYTTAQ
jgi:hypothetical protein